MLSGRFQLRQNLGVEGPATVWAAFDTTLDRPVLIKLLRADLAADSQAVERFQREMRAAARAEPTAGPRVLDAGTDPTQQLPFVVFEWLDPPPAPDPPQARPSSITAGDQAARASEGPPRQQTAPPSARQPGDQVPRPSAMRARGQTARASAAPASDQAAGSAAAARAQAQSLGQTARLERPAPLRERPRVAPRAMADRQGRSDRGLQLLVLVLVLVPLAVGAFLIRNFLLQPAPVPTGLFSLSASAASSSPVASTASPASSVSRAPTPGPAAQSAPPASAAQSAPTPTSAAAAARPTGAPSPLAGQRRRVANTDGIGVALRASPGGDKLPEKGYDEGAIVTLLEVQGMWAHIRGDDGREGWVLAVTLVQ